jgi:hypothetical protein
MAYDTLPKLPTRQVLAGAWRTLRRFSNPKALSLGLLVVVLGCSVGVLALSGPARSFGLTVEVRSAPDNPGPVHVAPGISTTVLTEALANAGSPPRWVIWRGAIYVPSGGISGFRLSAAGSATLFIDKQVAARATGGSEVNRSAPLAPGPHDLTLIYSHLAGSPDLRLNWIDPLERAAEIPDRALAPEPIPRAAWYVRERHRLLGVMLAASWVIVIGLAVAVFAGPRLLALWELHGIPRLDPLRVTLAFSLLLAAYPLWWGIPTGGYWAMDEIGPASVSEGLARAYSGGWHEKYPPFHYYVVSVLLAPFFAAEHFGLVRVLDGTAYGVEMLLVRALSVLLGMATVFVIHVCGAATFGRRAGLLAALTWSTVLPLVYHAKLGTLDVPYTFWFALSLLCYIRIVQRGALRDYLLFATAAILAICTKDQAYGLYALPGIHIAVLTVRRRLASSDGTRIWQAIADRRLLLALSLGIVLFAVIHNFAFNLEGFKRHVETITGGASQAYRYFENTPSGQWGLARDVADQLVFSLSWPATLAVTAGIVLPFRRTSGALRHLWLLLPVLSYYLTFLAVVGYCYDRFLLPVCLVLSLFAGRAAAVLFEWRHRRWLVLTVVSVALVYMSLRAASVNMLMAADGRQASARWLREHVPREASIGLTAAYEYFPGVVQTTMWLRPSLEEFEHVRPDYVLVNAQFSRRWEPGSGEARWFAALTSGELPYRLVHRVKEPVPLAILTWERQFSGTSVVGYTSVNKLNPEILIYQRQDNPTP